MQVVSAIKIQSELTTVKNKFYLETFYAVWVRMLNLEGQIKKNERQMGLCKVVCRGIV